MAMATATGTGRAGVRFGYSCAARADRYLRLRAYAATRLTWSGTGNV
jgi:hypothetical protein